MAARCRARPYRVLATDRARFVGDPVAAVLAETRAQARDAAEAVAVDWQELPSVTDAAMALNGGPQVWPELAPRNLCFLFRQGDSAATDAAFARAANVVRQDMRISRVGATPMEPRAAIGAWDPSAERFTLTSGVQVPHKLRDELAVLLGVPTSALRVISPDMGGAFGMRGAPTQEHALVLWAARRFGRPVRWAADRTEAFLSDFHARDTFSTVELALDADGIFLGLRVTTVANQGAYLSFNTPHSSTNNLGGLAGTYRTPHIFSEVRGAFTNCQPTAPYRGAGRPEATFAIERIIDLAADELGIDRVELRRRNLIDAGAMPFRTGLTFTYDSGDFLRGMDVALREADWAGFEARRTEAAGRGRLRGIGIANAIEIAGGPQAQPNEEGAEIRFDAQGNATVLLGGHNHGQGHETAFRQVALSLLGLPHDRVRIVQGDTDQVAHGRGTFGSRSLMAGGAAFAMAAEAIIAKGRAIAAHLLEAAEVDGGIRGRTILGGGHRSRRRVRCRGTRGLHARRPATRPAHGPDRAGGDHAQRPHLPERLPCLRSRDRPRDRYGRCGGLRRGGRRRHRDQPETAEGPDPWWHRAGAWPGTAGGHAL